MLGALVVQPSHSMPVLGWRWRCFDADADRVSEPPGGDPQVVGSLGCRVGGAPFRVRWRGLRPDELRFDNAAMETFWATLKREIAHIRGASGIWFETRDAAHAYLFEFIEVFYNRQRHQAGLGHLTPAEYAAQFRERP
jgi:hypothetical protein